MFLITAQVIVSPRLLLCKLCFFCPANSATGAIAHLTILCSEQNGCCSAQRSRHISLAASLGQEDEGAAGREGQPGCSLSSVHNTQMLCSCRKEYLHYLRSWTGAAAPHQHTPFKVEEEPQLWALWGLQLCTGEIIWYWQLLLLKQLSLAGWKTGCPWRGLDNTLHIQLCWSTCEFMLSP